MKSEYIHRIYVLLVFMSFCLHNVTAVNPSFTSPSGDTQSIAEDTAIGTSIYTVVVTDADGDPLTCGVVTGSSQFTLDSLDIKTVTTFDYETVQSYLVTVECNDGTGTSTASLTVDISDVNDNAPSFSPSIISTSVAENTASGNSIASLTCSDADGGGGGGCTLSITSGDDTSPKFQLNGNAIETTGTTIDYEALSGQNYRYTLTITGTDTTINSVAQTATATVYVTITPVNDNTPTISGTTPADPVSIPENTGSGTSVCSVNGLDSDHGIDGTLTYTITAGDSGSIFNLDPSSGIIYTAKELDYETTTSYQLDVIAVDGGSTPRTGSYTVTVSITNINDNEPTCSPTVYTSTVDETVSVGYLVQTLACSDGDSDALTYTIYSGNAGGEFGLRTGSNEIVEVASALDYDAGTTSYTILVQVSDGTSTTTATVAISVNPINEGTPIAASSTTITVSEDTSVSTAIGTYTATDSDSSATSDGVITYAIASVSNSGTGLFSVDPTSGSIQLIAALDYETAQSYVLEITATDGPGLVSTGTVTVAVSDINDNAPTFSQSVITTSVADNNAAVISLTTLTCSDADGGGGGGCTLSITAGDDPTPKFQLNGNAIETTGTTIDYEALSGQNYRYTLTITGTDTTINSVVQTATATVYVIVTPVNDNTPSISGTTPADPVSIPENTQIGTSVCTVDGSDTDAGSDGTLTYTITGGNTGSAFKLDSSSGVISTNTLLDYETTTSYQLIVFATDGGSPSLTGSYTVTVSVTNVNEHTPACSPSTYSVAVDETESVGYTVQALACSDGDSDALTYTFYSGNTGSDFGFRSGSPQTIELANTLDYDAGTTSYTLLILVSDGTLSTTATVDVSVNPINEATPSFASSVTASVDEDTSVSTVIITYTATDSDSSATSDGVITYAISSATNSGTQKFSIDESSGSILLSQTLDYETVQLYVLDIVATDGGSLSTTGTVTVSVLNVNDNDPSCSPNAHVVTVAENTGTGTRVITDLSCTDADGDTLTYALTQNPGNVFSVQDFSGTYSLVLTGALDYETTTDYDLQITVTDSGTPTASTTVSVGIAVSDVNEGAPVFTSSGVYAVSVSEDTPAGSTIITVAASDADGTTVTFSFQSNYADFVLDSSAGTIMVLRQLDRETTASYSLSVLGTAGSDTTTAAVTVTVDDVNESPVFTASTYTASISESIATSTSVTTVTANDDDASTNGQVTYSIVSGNGVTSFAIDSSTGVITTTQAIDYETNTAFSLIVQAADGGTPSLSVQCLVQITVVDENDNTPTFTASAFTVAVAEDSSVGTTITTLTATDSDSSTTNNNVFEYSIVSAVPFTIGTTSGEITVNSALDRETVASYDIVVHAIDKGSPSFLTGTSTVTATLTDVNDNDPTISGTYDTTLSETTSPNTVVFTITATDADNGDNARLTYSITSGNTNSDFTIESASGVVQVSNTLDRETTSVYNLLITVADNGGTPRSATVSTTVTISDVNDNTPAFSASSYAFSVDENTPSGTNVGTLIATDLDAGVNAALFYSIVGYWSGTSSTFSIDNSNGQISTAVSLDRETLDTYVLWCRVADGGSPILSSDVNVTITVSDLNDNSPVFGSSYYTGNILENTAVSTNILTVAATDADTGVNAVIQYSIDTSDTNGTRTALYLQIGSASGTISVLQTIDRESDPEFVFGVIATDTGTTPRSSTATVSINVQDENDNNPIFSNLFYNAEASYLGECSSTVTLTTLTATDQDYGVNADLSYYLVTTDVSYLFEVSASTGDLTVDGTLSATKYTLYGQVRDNGTPDLSSGTSATIRVDSFTPSNIVISFYLSLNQTYYTTLETTFISELTTLYRISYPTSTVKRWCVVESSSTTTIVHLYVISDNITDSVANIAETKTFLTSSVAQRYVAVDESGTPSSKITGSTWDPYAIQKVIVYPTSTASADTQSWIETPAGIAVTTVCAVVGVALIVAGIVFAVKACKSKPSISNNEDKMRTSITEKNSIPPKNNQSKGSANQMRKDEDIPEPMFQNKSAARNAYISAAHVNTSPYRKSSNGYLVQNRQFDGRAVEPGSGRVYEYNTKSDERSWIHTPEGDPVYMTNSSKA